MVNLDTSPVRQRGSIWVFGTLPMACTVVVAINALYILLVAIGNITDHQTNLNFVEHVLSMDSTNFGGQPGVGLDKNVLWRAITNPTIQNIAYIGVIGGEWFEMWRSVAWNGNEPAFRNSVLALCGVLLCHIPSQE